MAGTPWGTGTRNSCRSGFRTSSLSSFLDSGFVGGSQSMSNAPMITAMTVHSIFASLNEFEDWSRLTIRLTIDKVQQNRYLVVLHLVGGFERVKMLELSRLVFFRYRYHHVTVFENHGAHNAPSLSAQYVLPLRLLADGILAECALPSVANSK